MEHVVFSAADGGAGEEFRRVPSLEEAARVVEHLRNDLGVMEASVYALTAVPLAFRAYYRVEIPAVVDASQLPGDPAPQAYQVGDEAGEPGLLSALPVPGLLPEASAIPLIRNDGDTERSLGYFTR